MSVVINNIPRPPEFLATSLGPFTAHGSPMISTYVAEDPSKLIRTPISPDNSRPYVTLTFAQSIDAKIAGKGGKQLALSGKESLVMTHCHRAKIRMRTMHDAIMVGIGTALNDDPQLNTRHLPPLPEDAAGSYHLPRPIILDSNLRLAPDCKLLKNHREGRGRRPWVVGPRPESTAEMESWAARKLTLEAAGAKIVEIPGKDGRVSVPDLLSTLRLLGVRSLMVEGGATVIQSFLAGASHDAKSSYVDSVIVTVAPMFVGADGVGYGASITSSQTSVLDFVGTQVFGRDVVTALKIKY